MSESPSSCAAKASENCQIFIIKFKKRLSAFIDASKLKDNPTASKSIDVGIDAVGLVGGIVGSTTVPLLSVYASCVKTEIERYE